jgi:hypothetical protein
MFKTQSIYQQINDNGALKILMTNLNINSSTSKRILTSLILTNNFVFIFTLINENNFDEKSKLI